MNTATTAPKNYKITKIIKTKVTSRVTHPEFVAKDWARTIAGSKVQRTGSGLFHVLCPNGNAIEVRTVESDYLAGQFDAKGIKVSDRVWPAFTN